jgi:NhaP-type Na+/H+ or K+/H+ antiporter
MEGNLEITLLIVITVVAGIAAQVIAAWAKVPSIVFLLLFGILLGPSGFGILHPTLLGKGLEVIVSLSVAIILFEGGLNLPLREMGAVSGSLRNLVTVGALMTLLGGGLVAHWLAEFPWRVAFVYASLIVVTGPTVVAPLLKQVGAERRISTLLESEGVLIDPIGAILAVVVLNVVLQGNAEPWIIVQDLLSRLLVGGAIGAIGGWLLAKLFQSSTFLPNELKNLSVLAAVWGLYGLSQATISESGLMAVVALGIALRAAELPEERLLRRFKLQLSVLSISMLFILLSADLAIAGLFTLGWRGWLTVIVLMVVVRPLNVLLSTWNSDLTWRQKAFLAWIAPRGIVAASVASLFSITLTKAGITGGDAIKALVFLTIVLTVFVQGLTARWVARWLKVQSSEATGAMIVGCNPLGRLIAHLIEEQGEPVIMIDADPDYCAQATAESLTVYQTSALDMAALNKAGVATVGTFLTVTSNGEVNSVLAQRVLEEFRPPRVLAVFPEAIAPNAQTVAPEKLATQGVKRAFSTQVSVKDWSQFITTHEVSLKQLTLSEDATQYASQCNHIKAFTNLGTLIPLLLIRATQLRIMQVDEDLQSGDRIFYGLRIPKETLYPRKS